MKKHKIIWAAPQHSVKMEKELGCQLDIVKKTEQRFGHMLKTNMVCKTAGMPGKGAIRPKEESEKVDEEKQSLHQS